MASACYTDQRSLTVGDDVLPAAVSDWLPPDTAKRQALIRACDAVSQKPDA